MLTLSRKHLLFLLIAALPIWQSCSRARYQQIVPRRQLQIAEPVVPATVQPAPPLSQGPAQDDTSDDLPTSTSTQTPADGRADGNRDNNDTNDTSPEPRITTTVTTRPPHTPGVTTDRYDNDDVPWMDPSRYGSAGGKMARPRPPATSVEQPPASGPQQPAYGECPMRCYGLNTTFPAGAGPGSAGLSAGKLDLLFVVDTGTKLNSQEIDALEAMVLSLPSGLDLNIGLIEARNSTAVGSGRPARINLEPEVLESRRMGANEFRQGLYDKLAGAHADVGVGDGISGVTNLGLQTLSTALRDGPSDHTALLNLGLFRFNAALAVVFISDVLGQTDEAHIYQKVRRRKPTARDIENNDRLITPDVAVGVVTRRTFAADMARLRATMRTHFGSAPSAAEFTLDRPGPVDFNTVCVLSGDSEADLRETKFRFVRRGQRDVIQVGTASRANSPVIIYWCADRTDDYPGKRSMTQEEKYNSISIDPRCETLKRRLHGP